MLKTIIGSVAGLALASTAAYAQSTAGAGAAISGPEGSVAGGVTAGTMEKLEKKERKRHRDRRDDDRAPAADANSATTYGAGSIYTDRNRATGAVTAGGSATGTDSQSATSTVDAYGATGPDGGSEAEAYGDATAESGR